MKELKIASYNLRGFNSAIPYIRKMLVSHDILVLSEHWLHENRLNRLSEISNDISYAAKASRYSSAENYGTKRGQGGIAILWKKNLSGVSEVKNVVHDRICGVRVQTSDNRVLIIYAVYMPARGCPEDYDVAIDDLLEIIDSRETGSSVIIAGDINGDLGSLGGSRSQRMANDRGIAFNEVIQRYELYACNLSNGTVGPIDTFNGPTGSSTIDYIFIPRFPTGLLINCSVSNNDPLNASDHESVSATLRLDLLLINQTPIKKRKTRRWDKLSNEHLHARYTYPAEVELAVYILPLFEHVSSDKDVDYIIELIIGILIKYAENIPVTKFRRHLKPFWNKRLTALKKIKVEKFNIWKHAGRPRSREDPLLIEHKAAMKQFSKELRRVSREYENEEVFNAVSAAQTDRNAFWKIVKRSRNSAGGNITAIRISDTEVVHKPEEVLKAFKGHFERVSTPKDDISFNEDHFQMVNSNVDHFNTLKDSDQFMECPFTFEEVSKAVNRLHLKKASGFDGISSEHIKYAGKTLIRVLTILYNTIRTREYIPINFRRGVQVPLYKGKNACTLDMNNYRGITLLTNFNKIFEILIWNRLEDWWKRSGVISNLQGACRKGQSCVHTAYLLQETVSSALERKKNVFVAFYDVSKAFDTVWIKGLFFKLYNMGIRGITWRLLYRSYIDFFCKVRIGDETSNWFQMRCGIHQGVFLSLIKYVAFINDLIIELRDSQLCCNIHGIMSTPPGYADDLATACDSKSKMDGALEIVGRYGKKWRFDFNTKKSAIMVYGENQKANRENSNHRVFKLNGNRILERDFYDHVGVKSVLYKDNNPRVAEKIQKGRRAFNACTGVGIRKNGLTMMSSSLIFWSIIMPIITFGAEIWCLSESDQDQLMSFQRHVGKRIQRLPLRAPNSCSFFGLGWLRVTTFILIKKLLFVLTILRLDVDSIIRRVFIDRVAHFRNIGINCDVNPLNSPTLDMLISAKRFGLLSIIFDMCTGNLPIAQKNRWSRLVWDKAWEIEDLFWSSTTIIHKDNDLLVKALTETKYLSWWAMSDNQPHMISVCKTMVKLISHSSRLKGDDIRLKGLTPSHRTCIQCDMFQKESLHHIVMQCPKQSYLRQNMYIALYACDSRTEQMINDNPHEVFNWLIGKAIGILDPGPMNEFWSISGSFICSMYRQVCMSRSGIG